MAKKFHNKKKEKFRKEAAGSLERGDLIPMDIGQREFLKVHNKFVNNPEMEAIMATDDQKGTKMVFSVNPLPWEAALTPQEEKHLKQARQKEYSCRNEKCKAFGKPQQADYFVVTHKKELDTDENTLNKFGRREQIVNHCGTKCKTCGKFIRYVKYNMSHRRAARDIMVSGPHQRVQFNR